MSHLRHTPGTPVRDSTGRHTLGPGDQVLLRASGGVGWQKIPRLVSGSTSPAETWNCTPPRGGTRLRPAPPPSCYAPPPVRRCRPRGSKE